MPSRLGEKLVGSSVPHHTPCAQIAYRHVRQGLLGTARPPCSEEQCPRRKNLVRRNLAAPVAPEVAQAQAEGTHDHGVQQVRDLGREGGPLRIALVADIALDATRGRRRHRGGATAERLAGAGDRWRNHWQALINVIGNIFGKQHFRGCSAHDLDGVEVLLAGGGHAILDEYHVVLEAEGVESGRDDAVVSPRPDLHDGVHPELLQLGVQGSLRGRHEPMHGPLVEHVE
mmetsp:Transcript_85124/g.244325  ORF Transcript_85124/g.244325 Transcript_85124/m.244325 type:complete len:229 (+) Transcript_85124:394-1080(+)